MPGTINKTDGGYRGTWGGRTVAKHTSKSRAESQQRLLRAIEHGWRPTGKKKRDRLASALRRKKK